MNRVDYEQPWFFTHIRDLATIALMESGNKSHSFDSLGEDDVLTTSLFHKVLVGFNRPAAWPAPLVWLIVGVLLLVAAGWWWLLGNATLASAVAATLLVFIIADAFLLQQLPRRRISFGSWKGQFFSLLLPRLAAAFIVALGGIWVGWPAALLTLIAIQLIGTVALYRGAVVEPRELELTELAVHTNHLPPASEPLRILHISDLHIERLSVREDQLLIHIRQSTPDLILITGDFVNLSFNVDPITHEQVRSLLSELSAPFGVYAVLGSPPVDLHDTIPFLFEGLPVRLLRNEVARIELTGDRCLSLIGLDCHHDLVRDQAALDLALKDNPSNCPRVLLFHSPELMPQAIERGIDLYVCGHTHGGQVRLPVIGPVLTSSRLGRRYAMGHYHERQTDLYISRGVGFEGLGAPRVRLFCPPEITLVTLGPGP